MHISRSICNGRVGAPKTRKGRAPVPVIRQLAERLEVHRLRSCALCHKPANDHTGADHEYTKPESGAIFASGSGKALSLGSVVNRIILPALNRCAVCGESKGSCDQTTAHKYERDANLPEWHGWHAARRGLGSNLYRLGVPDMVIQRILRHANVSTTATYYIKTAAADVRSAMAKLEDSIPAVSEGTETLRDTFGTVNMDSVVAPATVN